MIRFLSKYCAPFILIVILFSIISCKHKKKMQKAKDQVIIAETDTLGKCRLDFKNSKALTRYISENELKYNWL